MLKSKAVCLLCTKSSIHKTAFITDVPKKVASTRREVYNSQSYRLFSLAFRIQKVNFMDLQIKDKAAMITVQTINVDGGAVMR
ncbi:MAG: hypothetical protein QMD11_02860 [Smithella sp.]|nr:hypothetical protein [Smithella sp.]